MRAKLAQARLALQLREWGRARTLLQEGALLAPDDPEIALRHAAAQLLPAGDARKAWVNQERVLYQQRKALYGVGGDRIPGSGAPQDHH